MLNILAAVILGLLMLIAACGCGSGSERQDVAPSAASPAPVPSTEPPKSASTGSVVESDQEVPASVPKLARSVKPMLRAPAVATGDAELDPLVSYLKAAFAAALNDGHRLVIDDTTDVEMLRFGQSYQELVDGLLKAASDEVPAEMIRDFGAKNRESHAVWPDLARHVPASMLTLAELKTIFMGFADDGWKRFYAKYPRSGGYITVSRVGLSLDKTLAIFYVGQLCGSLCGHGQLHVLKRDGEAWVELPVDIGPSWVS
jgi:hypothetical protein